MLSHLLPLLALSSSAFAQSPGSGPVALERDETRVFVGPFQARSREAQSIASLMPSFLEQHLDSNPGLNAIGVSEVGPVYDTSADMYLSSCPSGDQVGCTFVVGEVARAEYALSGIVESVGQASRVEVIIIDVLESREVVRFQADLAVGDDEVFAEGVSRVLVAVIEGEAGRADDIRIQDDPGAARRAEVERDAEIARQLDQLSQELGDVTTLQTRQEMEIERPRYTTADLTERMEEDGVKPWERVEMGPREYLRYKNSGMRLSEWRQRAMGRQGQILARVGLAVGNGPSHGEYYGLYARSSQNLSVVEAYSYQAVKSGTGAGAAGSVGYGLLPFLEVGVHGGLATGRYQVTIDSYVVGNDSTIGDPDDLTNTVVYFGPQVLGSLMPTSVIRPVFGFESTVTIGTTVTSRFGLPVDELDGFSAPVIVSIGGRVGAEVRLADPLDLFVHVPVGAVIAGQTSKSTRVGSDGLDPQDIKNPPSLNPISAGVTAGVQVRIGGKKAKSGGLLDSDQL